MTAVWWTIIGVAAITAVVKGVGPVLLGGRELPERFSGVVVLLAPALLTALVVTSTLADEGRWSVGASTVGVAAAGVAAWTGRSVITAVGIAVVVTAGLRMLGLP